MGHIAENLQKLLKENNLTVSDVSRATNIKQPIVHHLVYGKNENPTVNLLKPIADYLKVTIDYLMSNNNV